LRKSEVKSIALQEVAQITPAVLEVIAAHTRHSSMNYPGESDHSLSIDDYLNENLKLFAAWTADCCVGIVGLRIIDASDGELKSMHVLETARGRGVGRLLLQKILAQSKNLGLRRLWLETGTRLASDPARALYEREGFRVCPPFDSYVEDPESVFMTIDLR